MVRLARQMLEVLKRCANPHLVKSRESMTLFPFESVKQQNKGIGRKKRQVWQLVKSSEGLSVPLSHKQGKPVDAL